MKFLHLHINGTEVSLDTVIMIKNASNNQHSNKYSNISKLKDNATV